MGAVLCGKDDKYMSNFSCAWHSIENIVKDMFFSLRPQPPHNGEEWEKSY